MTRITKPMLAEAIEDTSTLPYPMIATPKIDGVRCLKMNGSVVSRNLKPIRNDFIRTTLEQLLPNDFDFDGELCVGDTFSESVSAVMSKDGEPDFVFAMFDMVSDVSEKYVDRLERLDLFGVDCLSNRVTVIPDRAILSERELLAYEALCLESGFEGVMLRAPGGPYKNGRSTLREAWLLKLKRFADSEAEIIGFEEGSTNVNEPTRNALGYVERSSAKAGKVPSGTLGNFIVRDLKTGVEFSIGNGPGLTHELRKTIWAQRDRCIGQIVKYKFQPTGIVEAPRFPQFLGFRDSSDMDVFTCPICSEEQFPCPSGLTCKNGHGFGFREP